MSTEGQGLRVMRSASVTINPARVVKSYGLKQRNTFKAGKDACELLKLLRGRWMLVREVAEALGWSACKADQWCAEWAAHGVLETRVHQSGGAGRPAVMYTLSAQWGGQSA